MNHSPESLAELLPARHLPIAEPDRIMRVVYWLCSATEAERVAAHPLVKSRAGESSNTRHDGTVLLALVGTASDSVGLASMVGWGGQVPAKAFADVLDARRPGWLRAFLDEWTEAAPSAARPVTDLLVAAGAVVGPITNTYAYSMMWKVPTTPERIRACLLTVPEAAGRDILTLLQSDDVAHRFYASESRRKHSDEKSQPDATWSWQIALLVDEGIVDRAAVIETCIEGINNAVESARARRGKSIITDPAGTWWISLLQRLRPAAAELQQHAESLLRMLRNERSTIVAVGQAGLRLLLTADMLDPREILAGSASPLNRKEKKIVVNQLRLLEDVARLHPPLQVEAIGLVRVALSHADPDLQQRAFELITRYGAQTEADLATLTPALAAASGVASPAAQTADFADLTTRVNRLPVAASRLAEPALDCARSGAVPDIPAFEPTAGTPVLPITDPRELVDLFGELIERPGSPIEVQQVISAAVRTAVLPLSDRRALMAPLLGRAWARKLASVHHEGGYATCEYVASVASAWATGWQMTYYWMDSEWRTGTSPIPPSKMSGVFAAQVAEATHLIAHNAPSLLLSEPTHDSGSVDSDTLLSRLTSISSDVPSHRSIDLELAALRLPPGLDTAYWKAARGHSALLTDAIAKHYSAISEVPVTPVVGEPTGRFFYRRDKGRSIVLAQTPKVTASPGIWSVLTGLYDVLDRFSDIAGTFGFAEFGSPVAMWSMVAPHLHELLSAHLLLPLSRGDQPGPSAAPNAAGLLDSTTGRFGPIAHLALLVALQGAQAETRTAGADVLVATVADGRLQSTHLTAALVTLAGNDALKVRRVLDALIPTTQIPLVGYRMLQSFGSALPALMKAKTRETHLVIDMLGELALRFGSDLLPAELVDVAQRKSSTALVAAARRAMGVKSVGPERGVAAQAAVEGLVDRLDYTDRA